MKLPFDIRSIVDLWETIGSLSEYLVFVVRESKYFLHLIVLIFHSWKSNSPMFNSVLSRSVTHRYHHTMVDALYGVTSIKSGRSFFSQRWIRPYICLNAAPNTTAGFGDTLPYLFASWLAYDASLTRLFAKSNLWMSSVRYWGIESFSSEKV